MFAIDEYPTASEQPLFTVNYGYSLPVGLVEGTVYSFKNAGSALYLDVCGGTNADNNNVAQYKGNSTVSQDFKLEKSSTGKRVHMIHTMNCRVTATRRKSNPQLINCLILSMLSFIIKQIRLPQQHLQAHIICTKQDSLKYYRKKGGHTENFFL